MDVGHRSLTSCPASGFPWSIWGLGPPPKPASLCPPRHTPWLLTSQSASVGRWPSPLQELKKTGHVYCCFIHYNKELKSTLSINKRMDNKNYVYISIYVHKLYVGMCVHVCACMLLSSKEKMKLIFLGKWMVLEWILGEIHSLRNNIFYLMWNLAKNICTCTDKSTCGCSITWRKNRKS